LQRKYAQDHGSGSATQACARRSAGSGSHADIYRNIKLTEVSPILSSDYAQQEGDARIIWGFVRGGPKPQEILGQDGIGDEPAHIGEGETGTALDDMAAFRIGLDAIGVDPGDGGWS
jgi:hypothetical protein